MSEQPKVTFSFVKLLVRDLEKAAAFYEIVCGLKHKVFKASSIAGRPFREYIYQILPGKPPSAANTAIILMAFDDVQEVAGSDVMLVVHTVELTRFIERALAAGGKLLQVPVPIELPPGLQVQNTRARLCLLSDNEGHLIEAIGTDD